MAAMDPARSGLKGSLVSLWPVLKQQQLRTLLPSYNRGGVTTSHPTFSSRERYVSFYSSRPVPPTDTPRQS